jgi:hypothetical protein
MNRQQLLAILFPTEPRSFPLRRAIQILVRTLHLLCAGILIGACLFSQPHEMLRLWALATVTSGLLLLSLDLHASLIYLFEGRGLAVLIKISLTALILLIPEHTLTLLLAVFMTGSFSSHAPRRYRHKVFLLGERIVSGKQTPMKSS